VAKRPLFLFYWKLKAHTEVKCRKNKIVMESLYAEVAQEILGLPGKMIGASKSGYRDNFPDHLVVFNSNVCMGKTKLWFGDIDITLSLESLQELASSIGETIYVLSEMDGRFGNENNPKLNRAIISIVPEGSYTFREDIASLIESKDLIV
jgi:hypothetical protein